MWLIDGTLIGTITTRVDLGVMEMEPYHQVQYSVIRRTIFVRRSLQKFVDLQKPNLETENDEKKMFLNKNSLQV